MITGKGKVIPHIGYPTESFKAPMIYNPYFEKAGIDLLLLQCSPQLEEMERFAETVIAPLETRAA